MHLLVLPILTGIFGWLMIWLFVKALFIPWKGGLIKIIAEIKIEQLITIETSLKQFDSLLPTLNEHLDDFFKNKLTEKMPMIAMFIGDKTITQLKEVFIEELKLMFPDLVHKLLKSSQKELGNMLNQKWRKTLEVSLLNATRKFRIIAFILGFTWGWLILLLSHAF